MEDTDPDPLDLAVEIDAFFTASTRHLTEVMDHLYEGLPPAAAEALRATAASEPFAVEKFVKAYRAGDVYPEERLSNLVYLFTDVRLQLRYLEFDAANANESYYLPIHVNPELANDPRYKVRLMAIDQSVIGRSRIAWEKLMVALYYMETGKRELPKTSNRSAKTAFFKWVETTETWAWLAPYASEVTEHDERYRTPEYHKHSVLRARIFDRQGPEPNDMMRLSNLTRNAIWPNILSIVGGGAPVYSNIRYLPRQTSDEQEAAARAPSAAAE